MSRILDYDPLTGETITFRYDHAKDQTIIGYAQDCSSIIESNKQAQIEVDSKRAIRRNWWHYACIPNIVILKWKIEHGVDFSNPDHKEAWMKLLNSPEYSGLKRTTLTHDR